ncbi:MAG: class I SAM-dependent DNA methyltransferase [Anaerolineae bacterium]|nr:class I SAM-dependent DNA methyltransferase [Anaerolineae bacterium]
MTPLDFVHKWSRATLKERSAAQEHFIDICQLVGHPTPAEFDPTGKTFAFEAGASKLTGGQGWADVWKKGFFAWEYKGKYADLDQAYQQLLQYRESLLNPPLLVVSDIDRIVIHTNFTNTIKKTVTIALDDLLDPRRVDQLRAIFTEPELFRAPQTTEQVTQEVASQFARIAELLRRYGADPQQAAHFLIRLLFCLFAEDIGLLPKALFTQLIQHTRRDSKAFSAQLRQLFQAMAGGGWFGFNQIAHFDGTLFDDDAVIDLDSASLDILDSVCTLDWAAIEPSIFGTLFERSLDPAKRSQLGAHYTSKEDILLIVEPVLMAPLRRRWDEIKARAIKLARQRDEATTTRTRHNRQNELIALLNEFAHEIAQVQVLDAACGSGNFLYLALLLLLNLWKEVAVLAADLGLPRMMHLPGLAPSPEQLHGIEINEYAHELAQATIWIGTIQWLHDNGYGTPAEPILKPLKNILRMDAILAYDEDGKPVEPEWPQADVIIGNPPFLGDKKMRAELGDKYVDDLRRLYSDRLPGQSDLVCYWFEKARAMIQAGLAKRAGLLATQSIRGGANRTVLERIKQSGDIFWAQSDRDWILGGAIVHVSMIGFDGGTETTRILDNEPVGRVNANLTAIADVTKAQNLHENFGLAFIGTQKGGCFDIPNDLAQRMLQQKGNPNGRPNSAVIRPWINGSDLTGRNRGMYVIDFGVDMPEEEAALYEAPFEYVRQMIKESREESNSESRTTSLWWLHQRPRPEMRDAFRPLYRYIATPRVSKHRLFVWQDVQVLPDSAVVAIASEQDYFLGVLHSRVHELWARATGTQLREVESGFRYSQTMTFETFPFPWPPGQEPNGDPRVQAIAQAARELVEKRGRWLNPEGATEKELNRRTLTNLYNQRPTWLDLAHRKLDEAVLDAYGWPHDLGDDEILERLLALNLERAGE